MMARVALAGLFAACGNSGGVECQCADPSVFIDVPPDRAPAVSQVVLSGVACAGAFATCVAGDAGACARYAFTAKRAGTCQVDVQFNSGPADFEAQVQFDHIPCCPGLYAPALAGSTIEVPDGAQDAGSAG
jgi:hypothetical protein